MTVGILAAVLVGGCGSTPDSSAGPVDRVLVVSFPGVTWQDVDSDTMPNLRALVDGAAVANLANRVGRRSAGTAEAYLTMGAGTRAFAANRESGVAVAAGEQVNGDDAAGLLARRFGEVSEGIVYLAAGPTADRNRETVYAAEVGMLGDELAERGVDRAVVANADLVDEGIGGGGSGDLTRLHREAAAFLMGYDGVLPGGEVSSALLAPDPAAPFGVRLDQDAVVAAFVEAWQVGPSDRSVVLVEASDLRRVAAYRSQVSPVAGGAMREVALRDADELLGRLLAEVDPATDAVLVVGVPTSPAQPELGIAALSTGDVDAGLARSATTGRDGYVQLADLAPTVLDLLGEGYPRTVEGRPFAVTDIDGAGRVDDLARDVVEASFRDDMVPGVTVSFIVVLAVLLAAGLPFAHRAVRRRGLVRFAAYSILGAAAATFVAGAGALSPSSALPYAAVVLAIGAAVGLGAVAAERKWPGNGILASLGAVLVVIALDVALGAPLQLNTVFGYSAAVAGRFAGLGNLAFAIFSASAVLLAVVLADRHGPRGVRLGILTLCVVVVIDGFPLLGADVGGSLAMVPAFGATALVLTGRRLGWRQLVALGAAAVTVTLTFAFVDLARPEQSQTHLARFARLVLDAQWSTLADTLGRRFQASFGDVEAVAWAAVVIAGLGVALYVVALDRGRLPTEVQWRAWPRPMVAAAAGLSILALLGWTANDSSFAVPATMLIVVVPVLVEGLLRHQEAVG